MLVPGLLKVQPRLLPQLLVLQWSEVPPQARQIVRLVDKTTTTVRVGNMGGGECDVVWCGVAIVYGTKGGKDCLVDFEQSGCDRLD